MTTTDADGSQAAHPRFVEAPRELGRICKALIFAADGVPVLVPVLVLMDGASRVDLERVREEPGAEKATRAEAKAKVEVVRETAGCAIGGVPPFGHRIRTRVPADRSLLDHDVVWAAAGDPCAVFPLPPRDLAAHAGATLVDVREHAS